MPGWIGVAKWGPNPGCIDGFLLILMEAQNFYSQNDDTGYQKECEIKSILKIIPISIRTLHMCVPLLNCLHESREPTSTLEFLVSSMRSSNMNTIPRTHADDGRDFHCLSLRRVVLEPWLEREDGVHSELMKFISKIVVAHRTRP